jgi:hypothetical protein
MSLAILAHTAKRCANTKSDFARRTLGEILKQHERRQNDAVSDRKDNEDVF